MILPIGDEPNPRGVPYITYGLIAINLGVFLAVTLLLNRAPDPFDPMFQAFLRELANQNPGVPLEELAAVALQRFSPYDLFLLQWGYRPAAPSALTLLTSMFLHSGWTHLIGNMLFLWIYGDNVEHRLGKIGYLCCYLLTGAVAAVGYGLLLPHAAGGVPMVGASGAISGVLGFYFVWFPRNKVRLLVLLFPFFFDVWKVNARLVLGFYLLIENLLPFLFTQSSTGGGVAYGAHLGGFIAGVAVAALVNLGQSIYGRRQADRCHTPAARGPEWTGGDAEAVVAAAQRHDYTAAVSSYLSLFRSERRRVPVEVVAELAEWLSKNQQPDAGLSLLRHAIADHPQGPELARALLSVGIILLEGKRRPTAAYQYLLDALDADPSDEVAAAARQALATIEALQKLEIRRGQGPFHN